MAYIEFRHAGKSFGVRRVLHDINLSIEEGEFVSIVGASGSGKTTLVKLASGLAQPDEGAVHVGGQRVTDFPRSAAVVFQNYSLLPWLSALENVRLSVESAFPDWPGAKQKDQAVAYLERVGLGAALAKRPSHLSGGMRQRVAIARAFAVQPKVLFLDEPFGALDALTRATLQQQLATLCQTQVPQATVLMITNSVDEAILLSDRIVALSRGPGATLSSSAPVALARPRSADMMMHDANAVRVRASVTDFLTSNSARPTATAFANERTASAVPVEA
jgi:nitrate/nitrite transport system ATP-binding protein